MNYKISNIRLFLIGKYPEIPKVRCKTIFQGPKYLFFSHFLRNGAKIQHFDEEKYSSQSQPFKKLDFILYISGITWYNS